MSVLDARCKAWGCTTGNHDKSYAMKARCTNCGWEGTMILSYGHQKPVVSKPTCSECGCATVIAAH